LIAVCIFRPRCVSASASTEMARNHSSSSIAVTTGNASSESGQPRYGRFREPAGGRRSYVQRSTGATIQSTTIANAKRLRIASAKRLSLWKASSDLSQRPSRASHSHQLRGDFASRQGATSLQCGPNGRYSLLASSLLLSSYAATTFAIAKGRLIRCTVLGSTPNRFAIFRTPSVRPGAFRAARIRFSSSGAIRGSPKLFSLILGSP
jgi:hypothetical protein